jgi:hypothetical protein
LRLGLSQKPDNEQDQSDERYKTRKQRSDKEKVNQVPDGRAGKYEQAEPTDEQEERRDSGCNKNY